MLIGRNFSALDYNYQRLGEGRHLLPLGVVVFSDRQAALRTPAPPTYALRPNLPAGR